MLKIRCMLTKNVKWLMLHLPAPGPFMDLFLCIQTIAWLFIITLFIRCRIFP